MTNKKSTRLCTMLCLLALCINLQAAQQPPQQAPQDAPPAPGSPISFNAFLFTVATGATVALVGKGWDYLMTPAPNKELREQELKLQQEIALQRKMALIHELCKDEMYKETCQQLKQQYLESQLALNSAHKNA
ncbi:MAG: hypothetical protein P4L31_08495 [Candidatus Babeliales bacterium]|nr:hypothetical protein [Candidatus Babeliales bacterium]